MSRADPRRRQPRQLRPHPRRLPPRARRRDRPRRATRSRSPTLPARDRRLPGVLISPGPGTPADAGASIAVVARGGGRRHPAPRRLPRPPGDRRGVRRDGRHAPRAHARHDLARRARRQPALRRAAATRSRRPATTRSRSCPSTLPAELVVTSRTAGRRHHGHRAPRPRRSSGVQFHPESVLTEGGHRLLGNWLETRRDSRMPRGARASSLNPRVRADRVAALDHGPEQKVSVIVGVIGTSPGRRATAMRHVGGAAAVAHVASSCVA